MKRASLWLLVLTVLWAVDAVVGEGFFWAHDLRHHHLPWRVWAAETWLSGAIPLWSAAVGMGFPLMADGQTGVFYPPTMLLFMSLPAHWAVNLSILFHLWWAGLGAVWMGRKLGMESHGALLTGVAFGFSGFMAAHTGYLGMQNAIAWLPWAIGALVAGRWAVGGLCLALMLVAGHPQIAAIGLILTGTVALWQGRFRGFAGAAVLALIAASPQIIATLELVQYGLREGGVDGAFANIGSLPPQELIHGLLPAMFGLDRPGDIAQTYFHRGSSYWGMGANHWEMSFFLGLPVILLAVIGARGRRFWPAVCVASLLLMLGGFTPLWPLVRHLPGLEGFRFPVRFSLVLTLAMAVLAGHGMDRLIASADRRRWSRRALIAACLLAGGMGLARLGLDLGEGSLRHKLEAREAAAAESAVNLPVQADKVDQVLRELKRSTSPASERVWWPVLVLVGLAVLLRFSQGRTLAIGLLLLLYCDLWHFGADYNIRSSLADVSATPSTLRVIQKSGRTGRTATVDRRRSPSLDTALIASSMGLVHGTQDVIITSPLRMLRAEALLEKVGLDVGDRGAVKWARLRAEGALVDLLGVRWLLSEHLIEDPEYPARQSGRVTLYENTDALPGAFLVGCSLPSKDSWSALDQLDPRQQVVTEGPVAVPVCADGSGAGTVTMGRPSDDVILIELSASKQAMLVQTDTHYPGWTAEVDGVSVPLHRVNHLFRGVIVSEGEHSVVLRYAPARIRLALWAGLGAALLLSLLVLLAWRSDGRQRESGRS